MRPAVRLAAVAIALSASGCTLVFGVDDTRFRIDAGPDAWIPDEDAGDGGDEDAGDAEVDGGPDGGMCTEEYERTCSGGMDEDCDGQLDCNDFDCATDLDCCGTETNVVTQPFIGGAPADWAWVPSEIGSRPSQGPSPQTINNFDVGDVRALMVPECVPIDLGVRIRASMRPLGGVPTCEGGGTACANYASLVLTGSSDMARGDSLSDDLSIRVYHDGRAELRAADTVLVRRDTPFGTGVITVTVDLTPGVDETSGLAYVFATVQLAQSGGDTWTPWETHPAIDRGYLVGAPLGCTLARGLFLGIEGTGNKVEVDNVAVDRFGCANPGHFEPVGAVGLELDADDVDGTLVGTDNAYWTGGGFGSPTIQSFLTSTTPPPADRWELFFDASNRERTLEPRDVVHHAIGGSYTSDDEGIASYVPRGSGRPLVGLDPPDCIGMQMPPEGCSALRGAREPGLLVPVDDDTRQQLAGTTGILVYAREVGATGRYEIWGTRVERTDSALSYGAVLLTPAIAGCDSLRDPVLVPTTPDSTANVHLLFRCDRDGMPPVIRTARLDDYPDPDPEVLPGDLITPALAGRFARNGVRAPDVAVWFVGDQVLVRLWFVGDDALTAPSLGYAEGIGMQGTLPALQLYAANPVLRSDDPVLGDCPTDGCDLESIAVTRVALEPARVRLLVSRTPENDAGIEHVFVPLEQRWPAL